MLCTVPTTSSISTKGVKVSDYVPDYDVSIVSSDDSYYEKPPEDLWSNRVEYPDERWCANVSDSIPGDADFDYDAGADGEKPGYFVSGSEVVDDWIDYVSDEDMDIFPIPGGAFDGILPEQFVA